MPQATRTLPLAATLAAGTVQRVVNYNADTTLSIATSGGESIGVPGVTSIAIEPLEALDIQSNGVDAWTLGSSLSVPRTDVYDGGALLAVSGTDTRVVLTRSSDSFWPSSFFFSVDVNGDLVAIRSVDVTLQFGFTWTPTTGNNEDAGIILDVVLVSGTGAVVTNIFGNLFQSSRPNTAAMGGSHLVGRAQLDEGDVIGVRARSYAGQVGTTDLNSFKIQVESFS